jgi:hypothetical protein
MQDKLLCTSPTVHQPVQYPFYITPSLTFILPFSHPYHSNAASGFVVGGLLLVSGNILGEFTLLDHILSQIHILMMKLFSLITDENLPCVVFIKNNIVLLYCLLYIAVNKNN